jgi:hypothetical protein
MAFTSTVTGRSKLANKNVTWGTWTTDTTGGDINTGLTSCDFIMLQTSGAAVSADQSAVNETLPVAGSAVTIVCTSGADGYWWAMGR